MCLYPWETHKTVREERGWVAGVVSTVQRLGAIAWLPCVRGMAHTFIFLSTTHNFLADFDDMFFMDTYLIPGWYFTCVSYVKLLAIPLSIGGTDRHMTRFLVWFLLYKKTSFYRKNMVSFSFLRKPAVTYLHTFN